jgi:hypothetical protein
MVFASGKKDRLPRAWTGYNVVDGDVSDLRFTDPKGATVVGLRFKAAKGRAAALAKGLAAGFVVDTPEAGMHRAA